MDVRGSCNITITIITVVVVVVVVYLLICIVAVITINLPRIISNTTTQHLLTSTSAPINVALILEWMILPADQLCAIVQVLRRQGVTYFKLL